MHTPLTPDTHVRTLSEVTRGLEQVFAKYTSTFWVQAEVGSAAERGGHLYGTLVEMQGGKQIAKMDFTIWNSDIRGIRARFASADLQFTLTAGIKACLLCRLSFHPVFGLKLQVVDADPRFALGELEQRKRELIARLLAEGAEARNKALNVPLLPLRIGLITSRDSAAYHDILKTLRDGGFGYRVLLADALMQGEQAPASVSAAFTALERLAPDLIVLARGGGNRTELASLDSEQIARRIVACPFPVWTAIGHEIDSGVPDVVSHRSFKTPTALAEEIVARFRRESDRAAAAADLLRREWQHRFEREETHARDNLTGIRQGTRKLAEQRRAELLASAETLHVYVERRLSAQLRALHVATQRAGGDTRRHTALAAAGIERLRAALHSAAAGALRAEHERGRTRRQRLDMTRVLQRLTAQRERCDDRLRLVAAQDPHNALRRGYAIVHAPSGAIATAAAALRPADAVRIEFHDGSVSATITDKDA